MYVYVCVCVCVCMCVCARVCVCVCMSVCLYVYCILQEIANVCAGNGIPGWHHNVCVCVYVLQQIAQMCVLMLVCAGNGIPPGGTMHHFHADVCMLMCTVGVCVYCVNCGLQDCTNACADACVCW